MEPPTSRTTRAVVSTWSRDSTVHGPAISEKFSPPIRRPPISSTVGSRICEEASLYGLRIGTTCSTPGAPSRPRRATCSRSPTAPITVTSSPREGCALAPQDSMRSMTAWTWSSVAPAFITIIISRSPGGPTLERDTSAAVGGGHTPVGVGARSSRDPGWSARRDGAAGRERLAKSPGAIGDEAVAGEGAARDVRPGRHGFEALLVPEHRHSAGRTSPLPMDVVDLDGPQRVGEREQVRLGRAVGAGDDQGPVADLEEARLVDVGDRHEAPPRRARR